MTDSIRALICLVAFLGAALPAAAANLPAHFANADNDALVEAGRGVYARNCASCHGRRLQGQPLWQLKDQFAGRRAPAHDSTGHTWQHSDDDLFFMTKFGRFPATPPNVPSYMPAFQTRLNDHDIVDVVAFIKARWPLGLRATQAMLNPGLAGMPRDAAKAHWTLPPNCFESIAAWQSGSR